MGLKMSQTHPKQCLSTLWTCEKHFPKFFWKNIFDHENRKNRCQKFQARRELGRVFREKSGLSGFNDL